METLIVLEKSKVADLMLDEKKKGVGLPVHRTMDFRDLTICIELDFGMVATGKDPDGVPWKVTYKHPYGYIAGTKGRDHEEVDCYIGSNPDSNLVCVVHQVKRNGSPDEDKVFLGFDSSLDAMQCYFEHGPSWGMGSLDSMLWASFKEGYLCAEKDHDSIVAPITDSIHFVKGDA